MLTYVLTHVNDNMTKRTVPAVMDNDPEKIGIHLLEMLAKFRNEGIVE